MTTVINGTTGTTIAGDATVTGNLTVTGTLFGGVPSGTVLYFASSTPPVGYLKANGATLSTSTYAALFAAIGYTYGGAGAAFNLPDLRGQFPRGWDDGRGLDTGRAFGSAQGDAIRNLTGTLGGAPANVVTGASGVFATTSGGLFYVNGGSYGTYVNNMDASRQVPTAAENRPVNVALLACIKF